MTDYTELVKALLYCAESGDFNCNKDCPMYPNYPKCLTKMDMDAAAAIEALQAEVEELKAKKMKLAENSLRFVGKVRELDKRRFEPKRGEIVRCRECRWGHLCVMGQHLGLDGFCSKGEREVQE